MSAPPHSSCARAVTLPTPADMAQALRARLPECADIDWVAVTGSTNTDLLTTLRNQSKPAAMRLLGAHWQHAARGRAGRTLLNQAGDTLMFSCAYPVRMATAQLPGLSPLAGLAACETLRRHARPDPAHALRVKWPNDIQIGNAKLAGILVESLRDRARGQHAHAVVIGMGMNLRRAHALSAQLQRPVADWSQAAADTPLDALVAAIVLAWQEALHTCAHDGWGVFASRFRALDALYGHAVNVIDQGRIVHSGTAQGITPDGHLLIDDGSSLIAVSVGDVSIRARP